MLTQSQGQPAMQGITSIELSGHRLRGGAKPCITTPRPARANHERAYYNSNRGSSTRTQR